MRGALTEADGFTNIKTDLSSTTCTFDYSKSDSELKTRLDELSKTNSHIRGWSKKAE